METKLARISQLSKENPDMVFTSLGHLLNKEMLKSCHAQMDGTKPGIFTFLGFTHYCSRSRNGRFRVKRKTSKKKFAKKCREVNLLLVKMRTCRLKEMIAKLNQILTGYYHYYGITDNTESITAFRYNIMRSLFYCLNRRSQKKSYNWVEFLNMLDNSYPLVRPRIYVNIYE